MKSFTPPFQCGEIRTAGFVVAAPVQNREASVAASEERAGFTLVEMLVTLCLVAFSAMTIAATFAGGFRVWERIQGHGMQDQWLQIGFEQVRRDLHNVRRFAPIPFHGEYDECSFPMVVPVELKEIGAVDELGRVGYFFDSGRHRLCRAQHPYQWVQRYRLRDACSPVVGDIERVRFSYYAVDPNTDEPAWLDAWSSSEPPLAVKLELRYQDRTAKRSVTQSLVVDLPIARMRKPKQEGS